MASLRLGSEIIESWAKVRSALLTSPIYQR
jgi:hypothetical protein